jgi:hypothetical protein
MVWNVETAKEGEDDWDRVIISNGVALMVTELV